MAGLNGTERKAIMNAVKVGIVAVALASASAAVAENLVIYGESNTGSTYYYDSDTIRQNNSGRITVWVVWDARKDRTVRYRTKRVFTHIDCSEMKLGSTAFAEYSANDILLDSDQWSYPNMYQAVPGSVGYSLVEAVCAR